MHLRFLSILLWLTAILPFGTAVAQVVAPSRGGEVRVVQATATAMELSFGTTGTGQGRVVTMAVTNGMPVALAAVDGRFYVGNTSYGLGDANGKGYVVYNGSSHTATITGLQPGTYYYITNAEYNTDAVSILYNTRGTSTSVTTRNASPVPTPLPVELTSFTGSVNAQSRAVLNWATATERNTFRFAIERSSDGVSFTEAGQIGAAGTSSQPLNYQWLDPQRLIQLTYYRLRQVDLDGKANYSAVITLVPNPHVDRQIEVYPNPGNAQNMQLLLQGFTGENITFRLTDAVGHPIMTQNINPTDAQYHVNLALPLDTPPGIYLLTILRGNNSLQKRIVVSY